MHTVIIVINTMTGSNYNMSKPRYNEGKTVMTLICEGKPTRMRRLCLKTSEAEGRGGLGITSSSKEVYELML